MERDFVVDAARACSVAVVVSFHSGLWSVAVRPGGQLGISILSPGPAGWAASWFLMVLPLFFVTGGFAQAQAVDHLGRGHYAAYLARRARRLMVPLALFVGVGSLVSSLVIALGDPRFGTLVGVNLTRLLWFLAVYLLLVICAPALVRAQDRYGMAVAATLVLVAAAVEAVADRVDALAAAAGAPGLDLRSVQVIVIWAICHQFGIAFARGWLRRGLLQPVLAIVVGAGIVAGGLALHAFPVAAVGFGDAPGNLTPPTLAIAALGLAQTGVLSLAHRIRERGRPGDALHRVVTGVNLLAMTIYLWHVPMIALAMSIGVLAATRLGWSWALHPFAVLAGTWLGVALVVPWIARLENRLAPTVANPRAPGVVAGALAAFAGTWIAWRQGMALTPGHPLPALGVLLVLGGVALLSAACR